MNEYQCCKFRINPAKIESPESHIESGVDQFGFSETRFIVVSERV